MEMIRSHRELRVYKLSFEKAQQIYQLSIKFPEIERYALTDQIRRSSRSVSVNIAEAFRHRRYPNSFRSKLTVSEGEAAETQSWLEFACACGYLNESVFTELLDCYEHIMSMIVKMIHDSKNWTLP